MNFLSLSIIGLLMASATTFANTDYSSYEIKIENTLTMRGSDSLGFAIVNALLKTENKNCIDITRTGERSRMERKVFYAKFSGSYQLLMKQSLSEEEISYIKDAICPQYEDFPNCDVTVEETKINSSELELVVNFKNQDEQRFDIKEVLPQVSLACDTGRQTDHESNSFSTLKSQNYLEMLGLNRDEILYSGLRKKSNNVSFFPFGFIK